MQNLNQFIDHTLLKPTATEGDYLSLFKQAHKFKFYSVCVPPSFTQLAAKALSDSDAKIASVVGFSSGLNTSANKIREATELISLGADELDMVVNLSWVKNQQWQKVQNEVSQIKKEIGSTLLKVIVESSLLSKDEILNCCLLIRDSGADYIKTSTGFNGEGAKLDDVSFMSEVLKSSQVKIKASGGIKNKQQAIQFINAGASRLGTSAGVQIIS